MPSTLRGSSIDSALYLALYLILYLIVLPKTGWRLTPGHVIRLRVLRPISTAGLTPDDVDALRERARRAIVEQLAAWRDVPPTAVDAMAPSRKPAS